MRSLTLALMLALPLAAAAQDLQSLYEAARAYDATYLAARAQADSAQYRAAQAEALKRPSAALSASAEAAIIDVPNVGIGDKTRTGDAYTKQAILSGRLPLFNRASDATIEQARRSLEVAAAELEAAEQDLIVRLAQAYFDVLGALDTLATTRQSKAAFAEQLASAKRNFEVGTATIVDAREAQSRFDLAVAVELQAENDLRVKRIALNQLVGVAGLEPRPLATPVALPPVLPADAETWVAQAEAVHPRVRQARVGFDVAQLETTKARAAELPTVDAVASLSPTNSRGSAATIAGITARSSIGLQLNWPLYTGGATQNRIQETLSLEEKARNDLEAARRGVAQGTRTAYYSLQSGLAQVKALEAAEASTRLALDATQLGFQVGVRVNLDVLNAQTQLFQIQRDLALARYQVLVGGLRLRQAAGQLTAADMAALGQLLQK